MQRLLWALAYLAVCAAQDGRNFQGPSNAYRAYNVGNLRQFLQDADTPIIYLAGGRVRVRVRVRVHARARARARARVRVRVRVRACTHMP